MSAHARRMPIKMLAPLIAGLMLMGCTVQSAPSSSATTDQTPVEEPAETGEVLGPPAPEPAKPTSPAQGTPTSTTPAQKPTTTPVVQPGDLSPLKAQLRTYLAKQKGTYGIYVLDLTNGQGFGINSDQVFYAASTVKVPMALYVLDLAAHGKISLDERVAYQSSDYEGGTGILQSSIKPGDTVTVRRLVDLSIRYSDNIAANMLMRRFGSANVAAYMRQLGGKVTRTSDGRWGTTPYDMALYMSATQGAGIHDASLRQYLLNLLETTVFTDRIAAGVPSGVTVAHKIGTLSGVVNDIGLVFAPKHPFIISVFSDGTSEQTAPAVIAQITRQTYSYLTAY